jgi:hypothetical protein
VNSAALNGHDTLQFSGGQCLQTSSLAMTSFSAFVVYQNATANGIFFEQSADASSNSGSAFYSGANSTILVNRSTVKSGKTISGTNWALNSEPRVMCQDYQGTNNKHFAFLDGPVPTNTQDASSSDPGTASVSAVINIGSRNNAASLLLTGEIASLVIFSPALTPFKRQGVMRMLGVKYACGVL